MKTDETPGPRLAWENVAEEPLPAGSGSVLRRFVSGEQMTVARITFTAGSRVPAHRHDNEQFSLVLSGRMRFTVAGKTLDVGPGELVYLAPDVEHGAEALDDSVVLDVFAPPRADWELSGR